MINIRVHCLVTMGYVHVIVSKGQKFTIQKYANSQLDTKSCKIKLLPQLKEQRKVTIHDNQ